MRVTGSNQFSRGLPESFGWSAEKISKIKKGASKHRLIIIGKKYKEMKIILNLRERVIVKKFKGQIKEIRKTRKHKIRF